MNRKERFCGLAVLCIAAFLLPTVRAQDSVPLTKPPVAPVRRVVTDYYGTKVTDNYRYMENLKNPEVQAWMKAQAEYTRAVLDSIPGRAKLLARIREFDRDSPAQVQATSLVRLPGDLYFFLMERPTDNVFKLYLRRGLHGKDTLLADPETVVLAERDQRKGKNSIQYFGLSRDAKFVAVGIAPGGSENDTEIHVFDTATGRETGDVIPRALADSLSWLPDGRSFVYSRLQKLPPGAPVTELRQKKRTYLHVLGRDSRQDPAVFGYGVVPGINVDPRNDASVTVPPDSSYALGRIHGGVTRNSAFYIEPVADLGMSNSVWRKIADFSDDVSDVAVHGDNLYLLTYKNALSYKVLRTSARRPDLATAETVVPQSQAVVTEIDSAKDALYVELLDGGINRLLRVPYGPHPHVQEIALPFQGNLSIESDPRVPGVLLTIQSWTRGAQIYAYDPRTRQVTNTQLQPAGPYDAPTNIASVEVKARSYDGTLVPLSIVYPKTMKRDGSNPTEMFGYGAYGFPRLAVYFADRLAWYDQGGIYAVCHVRGGGEYGEAWHLAGKGPTKPNTWRDFIACAQYLIEHKYTSPARLAGIGISAGGILIGRAITTRPDLFAAALDWSGLSDMLRFETTANGVPNIPEFGSVQTKAGFDALYAMSPYAHVKDGTKYPAVLLVTGANDPRVAPWQMAKMAARLQAATSSGKPVLLRVDYAAGHGGIGLTLTQRQEGRADAWSFELWQMGVPGFQPKQ